MSSGNGDEFPVAIDARQVWWCHISNEPFIVTFSLFGATMAKCPACIFRMSREEYLMTRLWPDHTYCTTINHPAHE